MISDQPLAVAIKNFQRNRMVNLTAQSVKHFLPNADIHCLTLYKQSMDEYASQEPLLPFIKEFTAQTKYVSNKNVYDGTNSAEISGFAHPDNGSFFAEGYNIIFEKFRDSDQKLLMLAEDHFFTTGQTLREVVEIDWDAAYAGWQDWGDYRNVNGSILAIVPSKVGHLFPVSEQTNYMVEWTYWHGLIARLDRSRVHEFTTRREGDYKGDGFCTNSSDIMLEKMKEAGIL
ncbi:MAG: hypothetical protein WCQ50_16110 [Spirochaetota bacterium]